MEPIWEMIGPSTRLKRFDYYIDFIIGADLWQVRPIFIFLDITGDTLFFYTVIVLY
jgi:hypothetical protein